MVTVPQVVAGTPTAVLTVDIVDFSLRELDEQVEAVKALINMLRQAIPKGLHPTDDFTWSPAGDGGSLTFWNDIGAALDTAISLGRLVKEYNVGVPKGTRQFELRTGLHVGTVTKEIDFDERPNVWGDGMNTSARVASLAMPGQILASEEFNRHANYGKREIEVSNAGKWWVKHNKSLRLFNIYHKDGIGISTAEVQDWYGPFHYPLGMAIRTYEAMVEEEAKEQNAFRAAVLAKRLLDLKPQHTRAREIIQSLSERRFLLRQADRPLYHTFFSKLSPNALLHFFQHAKFKEFEKGEIVFHQGRIADSMMMVVSGEIAPYIDGHQIKVAGGAGEEENVFLHEGNVIGEMGLFNPGGKRTATLVATSRTITLDIDYPFLRTDKEDSDEENKTRKEIQDEIWRSYFVRTTQNQINNHSLFRRLEADQRYRLLDNCEFLPSHHNEPIKLDIDDSWDYWFIVVAGSITIHPENSQKEVKFETDRCWGSLRLGGYRKPPYSEFEVSDDAQLIRLPWRIMKDLIDESMDFESACFREAAKIRRDLGLEYGI